MPSEILALIDKPWLLALALASGAFVGIAVERFVEGQKRAERRAYWRGRNSGVTPGAVVAFKHEMKAVPSKGTPERANLEAAEQLRCVMEADFKSRALLNRPEAAVFKALDAAVIAR